MSNVIHSLLFFPERTVIGPTIYIIQFSSEVSWLSVVNSKPAFVLHDLFVFWERREEMPRKALLFFDFVLHFSFLAFSFPWYVKKNSLVQRDSSRNAEAEKEPTKPCSEPHMRYESVLFS